MRPMTNNNRNHVKMLMLATVLFVLSSCEKVIDLDLNTAEKRFVVEGIITDQDGSRVSVSQTKDFDEDNSFSSVSGALVEVSEEGGAPVSLTETSPGIYEAPGFNGTPGKSYSLTVKTGEEIFTATSLLPQRINLDTIYVTDELLFTDTRKIVNLEYQDPPGRGQSYRFVQYVNGLKEPQIFIQNDEYTDGRNVNNKLFFFPEDDDDDAHKIKSGDNIRIDMFCIDENVYKYWFSLDRSATGGSGQATPSNPVSNIKGGALGYFSAQTTQTRTMIVP